MKKLIVALFAVVGLCVASYAQDLSFKSFDKGLQPKGNLVLAEKWSDREDYYYQEWTEQGISQWWFYYDPASKRVQEATSRQIFFDELDFDDVSVIPDSKGNYVSVKIKTKESKSVALYTTYRVDEYIKTTFPYIELLAKTQGDADALVKKLKDKAFDMALELDAKLDRVSPLSESMYYSEEVPNGATYDEREAAKNGSGSVAVSESNETDDEEAKPATKPNTTPSNNSAPKEKTEITLRLWNKSDGEIDIAYESRGAGGSKTQTSISRRSTKSVKMKVGGRVFGANGAVLLTVTAAMDDTEQVVFK